MQPQKCDYSCKLTSLKYIYGRQRLLFLVYRSFYRRILSHEYKSVVRIDMKDEIEYDDGRLNVASKFEGMDEIVNIDFTMSGESWGWIGDSDIFSLSMKNVNKGIEYGNLRAFFKTQVA